MPQVESYTLDRNSPLPLYRQVETWLRQQMKSGVYAPGDMLPSVKLLCASLGGINHITVRQALGELVRSGLIYSVRGRGSFVAHPSGKVIRIGLVLPNLEDELTREIAQGVQEVLDQQEFVAVSDGEPGRRVATVVLDSRRNPDKEVDNIRHLEDMPLDGAVIMPVPYGDVLKSLVRLQHDDFPVVLVDSVIAGIQLPSVVVNNYDGGYKITQHLLESGRKRLAWIGIGRSHSTCLERFNGFRDALGDFGVPFFRKLAIELELPTPFAPYEQAVNAAIEHLLSLDERPDALVCDNDFEAIECMKVLRERGVNVPREMAVVGFDDIRETKHVMLGLTTVRRPMRQMGEEAAKLILRSISDPKAPLETVTLPISIVVRGSSVPQPGPAPV